MKIKKGVSLIVLVITIIVMVILAAAIIISLTNSGIINKANEAVEQTNLKQVQEIASLAWAEAYADGKTSEAELKAAVDTALTANKVDTLKYDVDVTESGVEVTTKTPSGGDGTWTQAGTTVTNGTITLTVGDYVDYKANVDGYTDTNGWRVLGAENGEILLVSSSNVTTLTLGGTDLETAKASYSSALSDLQTAVNDYGNGDKATGVRSIKGEDIDRVAEYDVTSFTGEDYLKLLVELDGGSMDDVTEEEKELFKVMDYGRTVTFSWDGTDKPVYSYTEGTGTDAKTVTGSLSNTHNTFTWHDGTAWRTSTKSTTATTTSPVDVVDDTVTTAKASVTNNVAFYLGTEIDSTTAAYEMLIGSNDSYKAYWLASPFADVLPYYAGFGLRLVTDGCVVGGYFVGSDGYYGSDPLGVRAVVSLESAIQLDPNGANAWKIANY